MIFQSTQPSQAVTHKELIWIAILKISIHTALAGCDNCSREYTWRHQHISIHTALAGCDIDKNDGAHLSQLFQSTQPSQAVTNVRNLRGVHDRISIHTALAGCDITDPPTYTEGIISIHTALAGCDPAKTIFVLTYPHFNPHSPRRL